MQPNFDPKLFEQQNAPSKKTPRTSSDRAVDRAREADEGQHKKARKFSLDEGEKKEKKKEGKVAKEKSSDLPSAFSLAARPPKKGLGEKKEEFDPDEAASREEVAEKEQEARQQVKQRESSDFARPDYQQEQALSESVAAADRAAGVTKQSKAQLDLMEKLLAKAITQMKADGKTETTISIKNIPLFANAKVTVTSFESAKGEFNVTFSELSNEAKQLLDNQQVKESMLRHLEERGYMVHILVATTEADETLLTAEAHELAEEQGEEEKEQDKDEEKREQE